MVKEPPFSETVALFPKTRSETTNSSVQIPEIQSSTLTRLEWQKHEAIKSLSVQHLNSISKHLWLAGRAFTSPVEKFALHRLKAIGFELSLIEDAGLHLLWQDRQIYLKPLPDFLLDYNFWKANLCSSDDRNEADYLEGTNGAIGLLLSYTWLIQWESDLKIAQANDLLDKTISYSAWMAFRTSFLSIFHRNQISLPALAWRYDFGNLSLDRINNIWSFSLRRPLNSESAFYGYFNNYRLNNPFFGPMFKAFLVMSVYATMMLTAMQVGLASGLLMHNNTFQRGCLMFAAFCISTTVTVTLITFILVYVPFIFNRMVMWRSSNQEPSIRES